MPKLELPSIFSSFQSEIGFFCDGNLDASNAKSIKEFYHFDKLGVCTTQLHTDLHLICNSEKLEGECDSLITQERNLPLMIKTADCIAVNIYDPVTSTIANIHAGWKGQVCQVTRKTIETLEDKFGCITENFYAFASPSLGTCCAEFSNPFTELPCFMHKFIENGNHVNLKECIKQELIQAGVPEKQIEISPICTCCSNNNWYSWRRNKETRRIANVLWLK